MSDEKNEDKIFNTQYVTKEKANQLLQDEKIVGYMILEDEKSKIVVKSNGTEETIFKYVIEEITQTTDIMNNVANAEIKKELALGNYDINYESIYKNVLDKVQNQNAEIKNISSDKLSYTMIEFYTLIAMTCLYGGILGMTAINQNLANMSNNGKRVSISPTSKGKVILSSMLASYIVQLIGLAILFVYTIFVLKVDYGTNLPLIIVLALTGTLAGLSSGTAVGTLFKTNEGTKTGIIISITMVWSFLSGMMGITMKYIIDKNVPIINKLNPASMITDGFYSLYYYDTLNRFYFDVSSLLVFALVMMMVSYFSLRRQRYDSI